jgi:hypothetical protein
MWNPVCRTATGISSATLQPVNSATLPHLTHTTWWLSPRPAGANPSQLSVMCTRRMAPSWSRISRVRYTVVSPRSGQRSRPRS